MRKLKVALTYLDTSLAIGKIVVDGAQKIMNLIDKLR